VLFSEAPCPMQGCSNVAAAVVVDDV